MKERYGDQVMVGIFVCAMETLQPNPKLGQWLKQAAKKFFFSRFIHITLAQHQRQRMMNSFGP